jgi:hypothetical protein
MPAPAPAEQDTPSDPLETVLARIDALKESTTEKMARLEGRLDAIPPPAPPQAPPVAEPEKPKELSRAELRQQVEAGNLTDDQMAEILEHRSEKRAEERMQAAFKAQSDAQARDAAALAERAPYLESHPDIEREGTEDRAKLTREYTYLINTMGAPPGISTEVWACQRAFGPAVNLPERKREASQEAGGGGGEEPEPKSERWEKGLNANQIAGLRDGLARGGYKSTDDKFFKDVVGRMREKNKG